MIKKSKLFLLVILVVLATVSLIAGCKVGGITAEEKIEQENLTATVTYYANGGKFENEASERKLYYKENSVVIDIGLGKVVQSNLNISISRAGYELVAWHVAETVEENGEIKPLIVDGEVVYGEEMNFSQKIQKDQNLYLCAVWQPLVKLNVKLVYEEGQSFSVDGVDYQTGDVIKEYLYDKGKTSIVDPGARGSVSPIKAGKQATFLEYYTDEACTTVAQWPIAKPVAAEGEKAEDAVVYAKYLVGEWSVVRNANDVKSMFGKMDMDDERFYLFANGNQIDCSGVTVNRNDSVGALIEGNGTVIKNLTVKKEGVLPVSGVTGIFGNVKATAQIKNLTIQSVAVNYTVKSVATANPFINVYGVCQSIQDGAVIEGLSIESISVTASVPSSVTVANVTEVDENGDGTVDGYTSTNLIFGGFTNDQLPEDYEVAVGSITCTINGNQINNEN